MNSGELSADDVVRAVWRKFRIKRRDSLPHKAWVGTRNDLAVLFAELGFNKGAEVGVEKGLYSEVLCTANPNLHLLCVDPWEVFNKADPNHIPIIYEDAKTRLAKYNTTMVKKKSIDAVRDVPTESLDFVYIDGLHEFNAVMLDIIMWTDRVKIGGIVAGHDYAQFYQGGVIQAVNAYCWHNCVFDYYVLRDREPSWLFVKRHRHYSMEWV